MLQDFEYFGCRRVVSVGDNKTQEVLALPGTKTLTAKTSTAGSCTPQARVGCN
jgi:hypothetical protein